MTHSWRTAWLGQAIIIYRDDDEVDRLEAAAIERIVFAHAGAGDSIGDLRFALVDTATETLVMPAGTGFGGRVNFERLDYWAARDCIYWVQETQVKLPLKLRSGWLKLGGPVFARLPRGIGGPARPLHAGRPADVGTAQVASHRAASALREP